MNIQPLHDDIAPPDNKQPLTSPLPNAQDRIQTVDNVEAPASVPKFNPASIYPTPIDTNTSVDGTPIIQIEEIHESKTINILLGLLVVYIIATAFTPVVISVITILPAMNGIGTEQLLTILLASILNPLTVIMLVVNMIIAVGILRRKESARLAFIFLMIAGIIFSLTSIVPFISSTVNAADATTSQQRSERSSSSEVQQGAAFAQERANSRSNVDQRTTGQVNSISLLYPIMTAIGMAINIALLVFITRPSVKRLFH